VLERRLVGRPDVSKDRSVVEDASSVDVIVFEESAEVGLVISTALEADFCVLLGMIPVDELSKEVWEIDVAEIMEVTDSSVLDNTALLRLTSELDTEFDSRVLTTAVLEINSEASVETRDEALSVEVKLVDAIFDVIDGSKDEDIASDIC